MNKFFSLILCAGSLLLTQQAAAQSSAAAPAKPAAAPAKPAAAPAKPAAKAAPKPAKATKPAVAKAAAPIVPAEDGDDEDSKTPDTSVATVTDYSCDHGQKITLFHNAGEDNSIGMRWQTQLLQMRRVGTTTGADRFENKRFGLIWIGIPAKGMLLDSRKGLQLANECRTPQQQALLLAK